MSEGPGYLQLSSLAGSSWRHRERDRRRRNLEGGEVKVEVARKQ